MTWSSTLARFRTRLGLVVGAAAFWLARPTLDTVAAGALIAALGEALRIWAAGHLHKSREVTSSGPYRWLGHPLYVGSSIMGVGATKRLSAVKWGVVERIIWAWVLTLPVTALLGYGLVWLLHVAGY